MPSAVLIGIDGLRPDALSAVHCPHLLSLTQRGAWTMNVRSVMPSVTLPCFYSMFHSRTPQQHGVATNTWAQPAQPWPGLVEVCKAAGLRCGSFYNWEPLRNLSVPGSLHASFFRNLSHGGPEGDRLVAGEAITYLEREQPDFLFNYVGTLDTAGHAEGWMSDPYLRCLEELDGVVGDLLAALPEQTTVLVTADHGGHERAHGTEMAEDMTIPLWLAGPGVRRGYEIIAPVSLLDVAPTLARVLGLAAPEAWQGRHLAEAFV